MTSDTIEEAVIGSMLISPEAIVRAFEAHVTADHFRSLPLQHVYRAIESLADRGVTVDMVTVIDRLRESGLLEDAGGPQRIVDLFDVVPTAANVGHYVTRLFEIHSARTRATNVARAAVLLEEGHTEMAAHVLAQQPAGAPKRSPLTAEHISSLVVDFSIPQMVEGLIDRTSFVVAYGAAGSGKSFAVLNLGLHVALGWTWHGRPVAQGAVVYIAAEAPHGMKRRMVALRQHHPSVDWVNTPLYIIPRPINLFQDEVDTQEVIREVKSVAGGTVSLVIVDTLARTMAGGDENDSTTMGLLIKRVEMIKEATGATVLVVHHSGKNREARARGHSSLECAAETIVAVERRTDSDTRTLTFEKVKEGVDGDVFGFELVSVQIGTYPNGRPATSAVVIPLNQEQTRKEPEGRNLEVLNCLRGLLAQTEVGVHIERWRDAFVDSVNVQMSAKNAKSCFYKSVKALAAWVTIEAETVTLRRVVQRIALRTPEGASSADPQNFTTSGNASCQEPREDTTRGPAQDQLLQGSGNPLPLGPFFETPLPRTLPRKVPNGAATCESAPRAETASAANERQSHLPHEAGWPSGKAATPLRGLPRLPPPRAGSAADQEEAEAKARIESLRPKTQTKEESDAAFAKLLDDADRS